MALYIDHATGEARKCFITWDGFMVCNFVVRKGRVIRSRSGKCLKFRPRKRLRYKSESPTGILTVGDSEKV